MVWQGKLDVKPSGLLVMGEVLKQYKAMEESGQDNPLLNPHSPRGTMEELCKAQLEKNNKTEENEKVQLLYN